MGQFEMNALAAPVNNKSNRSISDISDRDRYELARAGKEQVLKRRFGLVSMTGLSCGLMCTWESILVALFLGFQNGGPAGLIYGFIIILAGNLSVFTTMGELASMVPTAGGQYHWVSLLAPPSNRKFFSYITGWLTVIGWIAGLTAASFFVSQLVQALLTLNNLSYEGTAWQATLLLWAVLAVCVVINIFLSGALPAIEVFVLILHVLGFFGIIVPVLRLTPIRNSAKDVFLTWNNGGDWSTQALAFFIGLQGNALAFVGTDSPVHMSEEVKNATRDVPRSMILSLCINGCLAFGMLLAVLFSADLVSVQESSITGFPFIQIFADAVGSNAGATAMTSIILILEFCSALGCLAAASRMTWSFARDHGLPFSSILSKVDQRSTIPVFAILVVAAFSAILAIINVGSTIVFNNIVSLVLEGFYISYLLAIGLLLWRRLRGDIAEHSEDFTPSAPSPTSSSPINLAWGSWHLKGFWGVANNVIACLYLLLLIFFSCWPPAIPVAAATMNYAIVVTGGVVIFSTFYYLVWAKRSYTGPVVEVEVQ